MLGRIQHELSDAYGAENARKVLQAIMDTLEAGVGYHASWGRMPAPLFKQGRQPLIPFREFDTDHALPDGPQVA